MIMVKFLDMKIKENDVSVEEFLEVVEYFICKVDVEVLLEMMVRVIG